MTFDWKDGWLVALGFGLLASLLGLLSTYDVELSSPATQGLAATFILSPLAARRAIFGQPVLGPRRDGAFFRIASMIGLIALFFGLGVGALAAHRMSLPRETRPDFLQEELALTNTSDMFDEMMAGLTPIEEPAAVVAARQAEEREIAEREARERAAELGQQWDAEEQAEARKTWLILIVAIALSATGSLLLSLRYERIRPAT